MRTISQRELRNDSGKILRELRDGEEFEVTVNGESLGVLAMRPMPTQPQRLVPASGLRALFEDLPAMSQADKDQWRQDAREAYDDETDDPYDRAPRGPGRR